MTVPSIVRFISWSVLLACWIPRTDRKLVVHLFLLGMSWTLLTWTSAEPPNKRRFSQHRCQRKSPKQKTLSWNMQTCVCVCVCVCVIWCSYWPAAVVTFQTDRGRKWSDVAHQIKPPADTRRSLHALRLDDLQSTDTGPAHYVFYLDDLRQT